jgi:glycosyltransferase involved in cell wall biosynthesis
MARATGQDASHLPSPEQLAMPRAIPAARHGGAKKPRILFLGPANYVPGVWSTRARYILPDLFESLQSHAEIHMLTGLVPDFAKPGMHHLQEQYQLGVLEKKIGGAQNWLRCTLEAAKEITPDVVTNIFTSMAMAFSVGVAGRLMGVRSVLRVAGDDIATRLAVGSYERNSEKHVADQHLEDIGFNLSDRILVMSEKERQRVHARLVGDGTRAVIVTRGVDLTRFRPSKQPPKRATRKFAFVGRRSLEKGYDIMEAAAKIAARRMPEIEFHFAGTFDPGREGNMIYHGFVEADALPAFYENVDAFVLCSRNEGYPQALAEAMAMGKPCIVSRHLFEDMFADGRDALLVDTDAIAVADAIISLAQDEKLAERLSLRSREITTAMNDREKQKVLYRETMLGD